MEVWALGTTKATGTYCVAIDKCARGCNKTCVLCEINTSSHKILRATLGTDFHPSIMNTSQTSFDNK